ncbi:MAG: excinuclease ABC subunit C [Candidatus Jorgensenbacteria bacterium GW2011_GWA1_48_13]|nr:MAG: excinuclease ABC subunit C [Candidatus Jorgensenbacteria bacterium GW2011_GWA1_48_13]KKW14879.1 MAG: excinuclease ABC subunit C [Candidatus Jorgensenbacteria bacterium GW2011_GWB1_50_10]
MPDSPGVYLMKNARGRILYIGKAANLKRRVSSYFLRPARLPAGRQDSRIEKMVSEVRKIDYKKTDTALEALILEATLIKKHEPPYNVREKDDKSFLYVEITKDKFPRVLLVRGRAYRQAGKSRAGGDRFGPFTSASSAREALRIIRKIFPFSVHPADKIGKFKKPCFDYEIGLCPGTCAGLIDKTDYLKNVRNIKLLFQGKKAAILRTLKREMEAASKRLDFEKAAKLRGRIFALEHVQDVALIKSEEDSGTENKARIEGYDISDISGTSAVGAMVVFRGGRPAPNEYRKFKIGTVFKPNDTAMLKEVIGRRLNHREWPLPDLFLIDGGKPQVNAAKKILRDSGFVIPVVGIAKGAKRKKNEFIGSIPYNLSPITLIKVRNEAHRFAQSYHKRLRKIISLGL